MARERADRGFIMTPVTTSTASATTICQNNRPKSTERRLRLYDKILEHNNPAATPCYHCHSRGINCFVVPDSKQKCAECTRLGTKCLEMSQKSLNHTCLELQKKIDEDERLQAKVSERLNRNRKKLEQWTWRERWDAVYLAQD
jgi:hypothetical protein